MVFICFQPIASNQRWNQIHICDLLIETNPLIYLKCTNYKKMKKSNFLVIPKIVFIDFRLKVSTKNWNQIHIRYQLVETNRLAYSTCMVGRIVKKSIFSYPLLFFIDFWLKVASQKWNQIHIQDQLDETNRLIYLMSSNHKKIKKSNF